MKVIISFCAGLLIACTCFSQTQKIHKSVKFASLNQAGLLSGANGESGNVQSVNGLRLGSWFLGLGLGIDYYQERSVPLFLGVWKELKKTPNTPFLYANGGLNFAWLTQNQKGWRQIENTRPGGYFDVGGGYKVKLKNAQHLLFSAGYNYKANRINERAQVWGGWGPTGGTNLFVNKFNRVNLKVGIMF